jgi:hypothetical protein
MDVLPETETFFSPDLTPYVDLCLFMTKKLTPKDLIAASFMAEGLTRRELQGKIKGGKECSARILQTLKLNGMTLAG